MTRRKPPIGSLRSVREMRSLSAWGTGSASPRLARVILWKIWIISNLV
jgi:hypothetical protein